MRYAIYTKYGEIIEVCSNYEQAKNNLSKWKSKYKNCYVGEYWSR